MKVAMSKIIKNKMRSALCDEDAVAETKAKMYEDPDYWIKRPQRSAHPDILPAEARINQYRRQGFGKKIHEKINEVKENDARLLQQRESQD